MSDSPLHIELYQLGSSLKEINEKASNELEEVKKSSLPEALKAWYLIREEYERLDKHRKELGAMLESLNRTTLPEMFDENEVSSLTIDIDNERRIRFSKSQRLSCSMTDKENGKVWLRDEGHGDIIQETVNSQTLAAFAKSYVEDTGKDLPSEYFKITTMTLISATKT